MNEEMEHRERLQYIKNLYCHYLLELQQDKTTGLFTFCAALTLIIAIFLRGEGREIQVWTGVLFACAAFDGHGKTVVRREIAQSLRGNLLRAGWKMGPGNQMEQWKEGEELIEDQGIQKLLRLGPKSIHRQIR